MRRIEADATGMKTRMRLRWPIGGGVCLLEPKGKKRQKLGKGEVLPLDRSLLMGDFPILKLAEMVEACNPSYLVWWIEQGFSPLPVVQRQLEIFSEKIMPEFVG